MADVEADLVIRPGARPHRRRPSVDPITAAGAGLWCAVLVCAGYYLGEPAVELFGLYVHELSIAVVIGLVMSALWFVLRKRT